MLPKKGIVPNNYFEYKVSALEGLWDMPESSDFHALDKNLFIWTLMIMQPPFVTSELFETVREQHLKKKGLAALTRVRLGTLDEGLCCQALHVGAFDDEPATFAAMDAYTKAQNHARASKNHHEIYMSDFRRVAPEKRKTVLRYRVSLIK